MEESPEVYVSVSPNCLFGDKVGGSWKLIVKHIYCENLSSGSSRWYCCAVDFMDKMGIHVALVGAFSQFCMVTTWNIKRSAFLIPKSFYSMEAVTIGSMEYGLLQASCLCLDSAYICVYMGYMGHLKQIFLMRWLFYGTEMGSEILFEVQWVSLQFFGIPYQQSGQFSNLPCKCNIVSFCSWSLYTVTKMSILTHVSFWVTGEIAVWEGQGNSYGRKQCPGM